MKNFIPWSSQPLTEWAEKHAKGQFINLDGRRTHYLEAGSGEPIILIHGFMFDSFTWNANIAALAKKFKVYVPDLWGFGYSTREPLDYGYPLFMKQLYLFMDALNIQKASLIGHSMGGGTSICFALNHPDRVNRMILVDPTGIPNPLPFLGKLVNLPFIGEFMYGLKGNFMRRLALTTNWFYDNNHITDAYLEKATRFHKIAGSNEVMLSILRKNFFHTLPHEVEQLGKKKFPILIVWGRHDQSIPVQRGLEMHALLEGSQLEIIENVAHSPHEEDPERFNQLAVEFLEKEEFSSAEHLNGVST